MHVSWFQQLKFCQLVESFCLCKLAAYRMKSYFCNSPGLAVRIIPSDMNMVWSAPVPNDANAPEKEGSVSCNLWRKTLIPIVEQKDETDSKHVRISDLAGLEKQLHVSETCISAEIYCVQWRIFLDTIHLHHFASNFRRIHTHTPSQTWIWRFATTTASLVRIPNAWLMTWARTGDDWFVFDDCAFGVS